jgi:hypothetical protein
MQARREILRPMRFKSLLRFIKTGWAYKQATGHWKASQARSATPSAWDLLPPAVVLLDVTYNINVLDL